MKKIKLLISAVAMLSLVSSSAVYADGFAPGEGLYVGVFGGSDFGIVQPKVTTEGTDTNALQNHTGGTFETTGGGLGLSGMVAGAMFGYGYKMGDLYAGFEGESSWGDVEFEITSSVPVELTGGGWSGVSPGAGASQAITAIKATKDWTGGAFGRLGYYINPDTLLAFKGGVLVSKFDVSVTGTTSYTEEYYGGGPTFGVSLASRVTAIDPNLSVRVGAVYTDYLTASVFGIGTSEGENIANRSGHDSEVTGHAMSARIGVQYSFFDVNSLF